MILDRPLESVPTPALIVLHRGVERQARLIRDTLRDDAGDVCAMGSLYVGRPRDISFQSYLIALGLEMEPGGCARAKIEILNDVFNGTPEERREFMLRHIVNELRERGKFLPAKISEIVRELEPVCQ